MINWKELTQIQQLESIKALSQRDPVLIYKHSTSCNISSTVKDRLEQNWNNEETTEIIPYYLDLIQYRDVSDQVSKDFGVPHESPQVLLIYNGKCIYNASHSRISYEEIINHANEVSHKKT